MKNSNVQFTHRCRNCKAITQFKSKPQEKDNMDITRSTGLGSGIRAPGGTLVRRARQSSVACGVLHNVIQKVITTGAIVMHFEVVHGGGAWCGRILAGRLQVQVQAVSARCCRMRSKDPRLHAVHGERARRLHHWTSWSCQTQKGCDLQTSPNPSSRCCPPCTESPCESSGNF